MIEVLVVWLLMFIAGASGILTANVIAKRIFDDEISWTFIIVSSAILATIAVPIIGVLT